MMLILLPPSEGKVSGGTFPPRNYSSTTLQLLKDSKRADPSKLYSGRKEEAVQLNASAKTAETFPAIARYSGVVYKAIDYASLKNKSYIDMHVRIVSALFGLLKPQDRIPNYKLSIDKLQAAKRWLDHNSQLLTNHFIIDLLPQAYKKAVRYENGFEVEFTRMHNGKLVKGGHQGKHIKGRFVRWLAENTISSVEELKKFTEDGYCWNGNTFHKS